MNSLHSTVTMFSFEFLELSKILFPKRGMGIPLKSKDFKSGSSLF